VLCENTAIVHRCEYVPVSNVVKVADVPWKPGHFLLIKHKQALCLTFQTLHKLINTLLQLCTTNRLTGLELNACD
jgi:hypothetical protein